MQTPLRKLLEDYRTAARSEREKGTYFERLAVAFIRHDPGMAQEYEDAWLFGEWARANGVSAADIGIDAVAKVRGEESWCAIQCKFYRTGHRIQKGDIDSFLSSSQVKPFSRGLVIDTTGAPWSPNAELMLEPLNIQRIGLDRLEQSPLDWATWFGRGEVRIAPRKQLLPHQAEALACVRQGLAEADRGKLIMACGTGKTFTGLKIAEAMVGAGGRVLVLVPSLALMSQTIREWTIDSETPLRSFAVCSDAQVGKRRRESDDVAEVDVHDLDYPATTSAAKLAGRAAGADAERMTVVFATYQSIQAISEAQKLRGLPAFDLILCDEAHRTTGATLAGEDESSFVKVHNEDYISGRKRLYMTATPRVFGDAVKAKASEASAVLASMDDDALFGKTLFSRGFGWAVENRLLADYKVLVLAVDEAMVSGGVQARLADGGNELKLDDATKIVGCYKALTKSGLKDELPTDAQPMRRALAFCRDIASSKLICEQFEAVVSDYLASDEGRAAMGEAGPLACELRHVDGTMGAKERTLRLEWLKEDAGEETCRILTNARCLSEGVDVPALDAILFMHPRKSQIDVVQSVGRVMRRAAGKRMGYVILPIGVPAGVTPEEALNDNERYRVVWQILNALRSHDERFDAMINRAELGVDVSDHIEVIAVSNRLPARGSSAGRAANIGSGSAAPDEREDGESRPAEGASTQHAFAFDEFSRAIMAKIVRRCGRRDYWEDWATDIARIAQAHISRIQGLVAKPGTRERKAFDAFLAEVRDDLNEGVSESEAIEMLAQHLITRPVFEALFEDYSFAGSNPVSIAMQAVLEALDAHQIGKEAESLDRFYASVRRRAAGIDHDEAKQRIIVELYDKFFRNAFPRMTERLGIVYTPVEIVDFILRSVDELLRSEFGQTLGSEGVHILDPFTGTGTFITRLIQSGLVDPAELERKYGSEIHANEVVLLAYYIAAINIEAAYHSVVGGAYRPFEGICLTDTFQLYEQERDLLGELMPDNSNRRTRQKALPVRVIVGNPPYSVGQGSANDDAANLAYPRLDARIRDTYAERTRMTNKRAIYDSYIRAIRWASDRIGEAGIIGFVTNAGWVDGNALDGVRNCLAEEFASIHVLHLRGNQRTAGERSRREGGKIFGSGSRAPVAITLLVKNPAAARQAEIRFHDIGDYLSREEKLAIVREFGSVGGVGRAGKWSIVRPDADANWINQGEREFETFVPLASKSGKEPALFPVYSAGMKTNRDAWCYNSSKAGLAQVMSHAIDYFNSLDPVDTPSGDETQFKWCQKTLGDLAAGKKYVFDERKIRSAHYRPFTRSWLYMDGRLNWSKYLTDRYFPTEEASNRVICLSAPGFRGPFSVLMTDVLPSIHFADMGGVQCFPRQVYEPADVSGELSLGGRGMRDGISDSGLDLFRSSYPSEDIGKDDIFYYLYGLLHSEDYRERYSDNLTRELPRVPLVASAADFRAISDAGRRLADLHCDYDQAAPYPVTVLQGDLRLAHIPDPALFYRVEKMRFAGKRPSVDRSTIVYNSNITVTGIPLEAYDYVVSGKSAIEWVMERQGVKVDKASGIVSDTNAYANETMGDPAYPLSLLRRVITVSLETMKIIRSLPKLDLGPGEEDRAVSIDALTQDIEARWGAAPAASAALAILGSLRSAAGADGKTLEVRDILAMADSSELTGDLISALSILTQSQFAILRAGGELVDEDGERHRLASADFQRLLTSGKLLHPVSGAEVPDAQDRVVPVFELTARLG